MGSVQWGLCTVLLFVAGLLLSSSGCGQAKQEKNNPPAKTKDGHKDHPGEKEKTTQGKAETKHDGWWCQEHGVPEHLCSLCDEAVAAKCKKEGDWCPIHDRAKSQCFKCDPSLYKKFEAMYEAKFNKKPEPPSKEEFEK